MKPIRVCGITLTGSVCLCVAGEMLSVAEQFLEQQMHPTVIISAYRQALEDMLETLKEIRYAHSGLRGFYCERATARRPTCQCCVFAQYVVVCI